MFEETCTGAHRKASRRGKLSFPSSLLFHFFTFHPFSHPYFIPPFPTPPTHSPPSTIFRLPAIPPGKSHSLHPAMSGWERCKLPSGSGVRAAKRFLDNSGAFSTGKTYLVTGVVVF